MTKLRERTSELLTADDPSALPDDPETLKTLILELLAAYRKEQHLSAHLQQQLEKLLRHRYGRRSETIDWEARRARTPGGSERSESEGRRA